VSLAGRAAERLVPKRPLWNGVAGILVEVGAVALYLLVLFVLCAVVTRM